jgi:hypothetical protein
LIAAPAPFAERERELVARSAGVRTGAAIRGLSAVREVFAARELFAAQGRPTAEDVPRHDQKRGIVVQMLAALFPKLVHGVTKGREGFGGDLEAQDVTDGQRSHGITGSIASLMAGDEPLDVAHGSAFRSVEPVALRPCRGHARELSRCRPAQFTLRQCLSELRQRL